MLRGSQKRRIHTAYSEGCRVQIALKPLIYWRPRLGFESGSHVLTGRSFGLSRFSAVEHLEVAHNPVTCERSQNFRRGLLAPPGMDF